MKQIIGDLTIELNNTTIYIRETKTLELLKAKDFRAFEAMDKYKAICKHWAAKLNVTIA